MKNSMNDGFTAVPKGFAEGIDVTESEMIVDGMEYGEMNEADARESGYISGPSVAATKPAEGMSVLTPIAIGLAAGLAALLLFRRRS